MPPFSHERTCHPWKSITWWYSSPEDGQRLHSSLGAAFPPFDFGPITASPHKGCRLHQNVGSKRLLRSLNSDDNVWNEGGQQTGYWLTIGHFLVDGHMLLEVLRARKWRPAFVCCCATLTNRLLFRALVTSRFLKAFRRELSNAALFRGMRNMCSIMIIDIWSIYFILHINIQEKLFNHDNGFKEATQIFDEILIRTILLWIFA